MKHLKMLGLALVAAASLMAFAGSASAAVLTSPAGTDYTGTLESTATESLLLKAGFANITCTASTVSGAVKTNTTVAEGAITTLSFSNCNATVDVLKNGSLKVASGGAVTGSGSEVTVSALGTSCVYGTGAGTSLGTLKGGTPASLTINASLPKISGGFACASPAGWSGKYTVTQPTTLLVD
jgi:hypothetical protein